MCQNKPIEPATIDEAVALVNYHRHCINDLKRKIIHSKTTDLIKDALRQIKNMESKLGGITESLTTLVTTTPHSDDYVLHFLERLERQLHIPHPGNFNDSEYVQMLAKHSKIKSIHEDIERTINQFNSTFEVINALLASQEKSQCRLEKTKKG